VDFAEETARDGGAEGAVLISRLPVATRLLAQLQNNNVPAAKKIKGEDFMEQNRKTAQPELQAALD
jgi:hypothetical protein